MRIAVAIKQVPDTETKIRLKSDNSGIDTTGVKWIISPYDEHAIEEALKIRQSSPGATVHVYSLGPKARVAEALRTALAMGADEGVVIDSAEDLDSLSTAKALAAAIQKDGPCEIVLTGKAAIDDNASAVTQMLAEFLKLPHVTVVSKITRSGETTTVEREVEGGTREVLEISGPCVLGANKGLNVPRYASLPGIMKAKKKTLKEYSVSDLGIDASQIKVRYRQFALPPEKPPVKMLSGDAATQAKELARLLLEEAKVL